ncbi:hypothetical protein M9Y10_040400 [Tritrichomonas musculus]|uniref:Uncharacterized protein n=1 Tax=Tritrichomonas musculus TaxID=1915356 RepID=A0ABR2GQF1_9EUKA
MMSIKLLLEKVTKIQKFLIQLYLPTDASNIQQFHNTSSTSNHIHLRNAKNWKLLKFLKILKSLHFLTISHHLWLKVFSFNSMLKYLEIACFMEVQDCKASHFHH